MTTVRKKTVVLGLGNPLMSDEGIGGFIVNKLQQTFSQQLPDVDFIDAGTGGMSLLYLIEGRDKVVIVDCAFMKTTPGTIERFTPEKVDSVKNLTHYSLHEADVLKVIDISKQLGQCPEHIVLYGIEPETTELGDQLSEGVGRRIEEYVELVSKELLP